jgi:hypothetical protein
MSTIYCVVPVETPLYTVFLAGLGDDVDAIGCPSGY